MPAQLEQALNAAGGAARRAGDLLREEFHRVGGPRGGGDHAQVDAEVEVVIRRLPTAEFPEQGNSTALIDVGEPW